MRAALFAAVAAVAVWGSGCSPFGGGAFTCDEDVQCGASGQCEDNHLCSFPDPNCGSGRSYGEASGSLAGTCVGDEPADASMQGDDDAAMIDANVNAPDAECDVDGLDLCSRTPDAAITFGTETLDTGTDARCVDAAQPGGGPHACLIFATSITVPGGTTLTVIGNRPLALAATGTVQVDGTIDAGSTAAGRRGPAADDGGCGGFAANPDNDTGGAAGGAGGSFAAAGGAGGEGDNDNSLGGDGTASPGQPNAAVGMPGNVRGGCRGQDGGDEGGGGGSGRGGAHGSSGGAVWLLAEVAVNVTGAVGVTGAGGGGGETQSGGAGAGSGGMIRIAAPVIAISGTLAANGGGGGGGGGRLNGNNVSGGPGGDGPIGAAGGTGGQGATCCPPGTGTEVGGHGGVGGFAATAAGPGIGTIVGGGGGAGSVGFIILVGPGTSVTGTASPAAIQL
jgi:hypothetical protein